MPQNKTDNKTADIGATYRQPSEADATVVAPADDAPSGAKPFDPGFIPEGTQQELDRSGVATNPFTGKQIKA